MANGLNEPPVAGAPIPAPAAQPAPATLPGEEPAPWWPWLAAIVGALGLGFAGWAIWQRRQDTRPVAVPQIERPRVVTHSAPTWTDEAPVSAEPLQVTLEPLRLSLTLMNATLSYRLEIANRGAAALTGLAIGADMIAAHASMSREEQLAGPAAGTGPVQRIERLEPGESRIVEGEFRVPFSKIVPIRQGSAALLLPLARFRVEGDGARPVVRTFVVGQPGKSAGLEPFRLDLGPRVYPKLAQRAFA